MSKAYLLVICLLAVSFTGCMSGSACGWVEDHTEFIIDEGGFFSYRLNSLSHGETISEVAYHFQRHDDEGHDIDIYFLDDLNNQKYESDDSFAFNEALSWESTSNPNFDRSADVADDQEYYLIVDNTGRRASYPPSDGENNTVHFTLDTDVYKCP